jgi:C4-dicarboxylate-specific signal transduction histidine kinase
MATQLTPTLQTVIGIALFLLIVVSALVAFSLEQRRRRFSAEKVAAVGEERLALLSSMSSFGFWSWDAATDTGWANENARSILGLDDVQPLTGQSLLAAVHPDDRPNVLEAINANTRPATTEMELRLSAEGSEVRWITVKACAYCDADGAVMRVAGYVVDDCQRKRTAAELLKLQQKLTHLTRVAMLGELAGALAHELQQPLTAILCNAHAAQILSRQAKLNLDELQEILEEIVNDDKNAGQIIQRLRALLIRGETHFQRLEIGDLLDDVLLLARGTLRERNVQINTRVDAHIPALRGDRVELQQVLLNLVINACESMSANPARDRRLEIVVDGAADAGAVRVSVLDCGNGLGADQLERVFEPFFTTKQGGLGLGLSISQSIIAAHGGRLWATRRPDRGTAFHFTLPIEIGKEEHERTIAHSIHS